MKHMELSELAALLEEVWNEERKAQESIHVVVNRDDEEQIRQALDQSGYDHIHLLVSDLVHPGNMIIVKDPGIFDKPLPLLEDWRERRRRPLWMRLLNIDW